MKDLLEHIFGEIRSLSDTARHNHVEALPDGRYSVDGELSIEAFRQVVQIQVRDRGAHTVAGMVLNAYGELPGIGTSIELDGLRFIVDSLDHNRIRHLIVERLDIAPVPPGSAETYEAPLDAGPQTGELDAPAAERDSLEASVESNDTGPEPPEDRADKRA
jgi:Mg2+/Co2+ transporter CorC